jgi:uncharacterized protein YigA (DUF484 family)
MSSSELSETQQEQEALVAEWLVATPGFFDRHKDLLASVQLKSPHGDKAISLQEKQMTLLRDQNKDLNRRLSEMLRFGAENDRTQNLMVDWINKLLSERDHESAIATVTDGLKNIFDLTDVKLIKSDLLSAETIENLKQAPYCGQNNSAPRGLSEFLPGDGGSVAALFLADQKDLGVLLLISQSPERFTKEMGLVYLRQLAQLAAATIGRFEA